MNPLDSKAARPVPVTWIPAHPAYGAISMRRYWQELDRSRRPGDPFSISSVLQPRDTPVSAGLSGSARRYWTRRFVYPATLRRQAIGEIAHVLDHSWADMLSYLPSGTLKVVTVHDLIPLRYPGELRPAQARRFEGWVSHARGADAVIADSCYTRDEVVRLLDVAPDKITVVPCGVEIPDDAAGSTEPLIAPRPDHLTVGSIGSAIARKNLAILPGAFAKYTGAKKIRLVRVGAALPTALADELRGVLGDGGLIELGHLSDADVGRFYRAMDVIVMPSLYEGFGLPVLEALARGVPVISSNATSLTEVGGDEALYFDPQDPAELAVRLREVAGRGISADWKSRALARAAGFSWRASLEGIYAVYNKLLDRQRGTA